MQPNEAPERIWTDGFDYSSKPSDTIGRTGYVRADLHTALEAEVARLREALGEIATDEHPLGWIAIAALAQGEQPWL